MIAIKKGSNSFYVGDREEDPLAEMTLLNVEDEIIIIEHTIVSDQLRGQNVARLLLQAVVDFARAENKKIIPRCPFSQAEFSKNKDYADVLQQ